MLLAIPVLLIVAVAANFGSVRAVVSGERSIRSILLGLTHVPRPDEKEMLGFQLPADVGSEDANVALEVFLQEGVGCHTSSLFTGIAISEIDPDRIRVDFVDTTTQDGHERLNEVKMGCEQGMAVNGKVKFTVPAAGDEAGDRKGRVVYLNGGHGKEKWSPTDLFHVLDAALAEGYDGDGMSVAVDDFVRAFPQTVDRIQGQMMAEARARSEATGRPQGAMGGMPSPGAGGFGPPQPGG